MLVVLASLLLTAGMCFGQSTSNDSVQNPGFPRVVAKLNLFNQTNAVDSQTLYTPMKSGVFRISVTMVCTIPNGQSGGSWESFVSWTNEAGQNGPFVVANITTATRGSSQPLANSPFVFDANGGEGIAISTDSTLHASGTQYSAYVILEQLE
jgi:hypothetical protein